VIPADFALLRATLPGPPWDAQEAFFLAPSGGDGRKLLHAAVAAGYWLSDAGGRWMPQGLALHLWAHRSEIPRIQAGPGPDREARILSASTLAGVAHLREAAAIHELGRRRMLAHVATWAKPGDGAVLDAYHLAHWLEDGLTEAMSWTL